MRHPSIHDHQAAGADACRKKFLRFFPLGFKDPKYVDWERGYKWLAHEEWKRLLDEKTFQSLLRRHEFAEIAARAVRLESRTNLLFSFEKMALRDAVRSPIGARNFATGLYRFIYGDGTPARRFENWCEVVASLPRKQTRVLTWPVVTVFGFIAQPQLHIFYKPTVTRRAAEEYGFNLHYQSRPSLEAYAELLHFAEFVRHSLKDLHPRDMIDIQSFLWTLGSDEYAE